MFDTVRCRFPLPHHQDAEFQTKDLEHVVFGEGGEGTMSLYEITEDGRLRRRAHRYRIVRKKPGFRRVPLKSTKTWWEDVTDAHGDVYIYTFERSSDTNAPCEIRFRVRFTNGRVQDVRQVKFGRTRTPAVGAVSKVSTAGGAKSKSSAGRRRLR
jgi:hypothetical protein